jgi:hypothetical protein
LKWCADSTIVVLYEPESTLMEIGVRFGVSQGTVHRAGSANGGTIRPRGHRVLVDQDVGSGWQTVGRRAEDR